MTLLLTGAVSYFSEASLLQAFPEERLVVLGNLAGPSRKIRQVSFTESADLQLLFTSYNIDQIIYFSHSVNAISKMDMEIYQLRRILESLNGVPSPRFLYVTGPDSNFQTDSSRRIILASAEELCQYYAAAYSFSFKLLRSLYLYNLQDEADSLGQLLLGQQESEQPAFKVHPDQVAYYIYPQDLLVLCYRILDTWTDDFEAFSIADAFHTTYSELFKSLNLSESGLFSAEQPIRELVVSDTALREVYGWFPKVSILEDLGDFVRQTQEAKVLTVWQRLLQVLRRHAILVRLAQFFSLFAISETLSYTLGQQVYFKTVDYRLFFVMAAGFLFGTNMGLLAALLATVGLVAQNILSGSSNLATLFFEPSNWIPYMIYFISAMISSYAKEKDQGTLAGLKEENADLRQQLATEGQFIDDMLTEKAELTHQILGRQDSYGKIYQFLQHLETPHLDIFVLRLLQYLSEIFETESISIYSVQQDQLGELQFSLDTCPVQLEHEETVEDIFAHIEEEGIWVNHHLREDFPMYISALSANDTMHYCLFIQNVSVENLNLYHQNLFKVLMGLANHSYQRLQSANNRLKKNGKPQIAAILEDNDFYQKLLAVKELDSQYFNGQVLRLTAPDLLPAALVQLLASKQSIFDSLGLVHGDYYLLYNARTAELSSDWRHYLKQQGLEIAALQSLEETIESLQF